MPVLTRESDTLVHGSYRPQNVLVAQACDPPRICPTDWELAALGRSTYDLAFICDGFRPPRLDAVATDGYLRLAAILVKAKTPEDYTAMYVRFALANPREYWLTFMSGNTPKQIKSQGDHKAEVVDPTRPGTASLRSQTRSGP